MEQKQKNKKIRLGFKAKILSVILPVNVVMVLVLILIAYIVSRADIMNASRQLLATSAKDQSHQIENWLNKKIDVAKTVKYDIENSGALSDDNLMQQKLDYYLNLDSSFSGGFYVADLNGNVIKATDSDLDIGSVSNSVWFEEGQTHKNPSITKVYTDDAGNSKISACGLLNDLNNLRVFSANLSLDSINIIVNSSVSMSNAESLLIDKTDGTILVARDSALVSKSIDSTSDEFLNAVSKKMKAADYSMSTVEDKETVIKEINGTNWVLVSYIDKAQITKEVDGLRNVLIIVAIISLILLSVIIYFAVHFSVRPLVDLNSKLRVMSEGDFTVNISPRGNDEISEIQRSMQFFIEKMRELIRGINDITTQLQNQADNSSSVSINMHDASEAQADSISALSDTMEQFSLSINEIAQSATNLSSVVADTCADSDDVKVQIGTTVEMSQKGREDMQRVNDAMNEIRESIKTLVEAINQVGAATKEITGITTLIGDISEETSLLSLNASIEAARAGEAGRGFAVVATEISNLANTTADSVDGISKLISQVESLVSTAINQVDLNVENINESGERIQVALSTFDKIYDSIQNVDTIMDKMLSEIETVNNVAMDVSAISEEQAASTTVISDTSEGMVEQAKKLATQSEQVADGAKILTQTSEALTNQMSKFHI